MAKDMARIENISGMEIFLKSFLVRNDYLSDRQIALFAKTLECINDKYKRKIMASFENKCVFETRAFNMRVLIENLVSVIVEIINVECENSLLDIESLSNYEAKKLKEIYYLNKILGNSEIVKELKEKVLCVMNQG